MLVKCRKTLSRRNSIHAVRSIDLSVSVRAVQICRVDAIGIARVGTVRKDTKVVRSKSSLFSNLILFHAGKKLLCSLVCGETILRHVKHVILHVHLSILTGKASQTL